MKLKRRCFGIVLFFMFLLSPALVVMANESEIFLVGMSDMWPLEYYDEEQGRYSGVLPELLQKAAEKEGLTVHYIKPAKSYDRLHLAKNIQADGLCAIGLNEDEANQVSLQKGFEVLSYHQGEESILVELYYTESMSESDLTKLSNGLSRISPGEIQGLFLKYTVQKPFGLYFSNTIKNFMLIIAITTVVLIITLIVILKKRKKQIQRAMYRDIITEGENLVSWKEKYNTWIVDENRYHYAVLQLATGIEQISHIYGYAEAEEALRLLADICEPFIDKTREAYARFHEWNFVFFIRYTEIEMLKQRVRTMHEDIIQVFCEKKSYFLDLHVGIYQLTEEGKDVLKALQYSELAMEYAGNHYLEYIIYNNLVEKETVSNYAMEHEAIRGLMQKEFIIFLQPIVSLVDQQISGAELLVRWQNPRRGLLRPAEFMDVMKKKQLTGEMNMDMFRQGCKFLNNENKKGNHIKLLVNFTVENVGNEQFVEHLILAVQQYEITASQLIIQLNQMVEMSHSEMFRETIKKLRQQGFDVCLSGLELDRVFFEYLESGVNRIKLRQEVIHQLDKEEGRIIVKNIISLCHKLKLEVLCVGVENEEQEAFLREEGCEMASGFKYYYPMSQDEFSSLLIK